MAVTETERELFFQDKLVKKYGISTDFLTKTDATEDEVNTYIKEAENLVEKFKKGLRQMELKDYKDIDPIDIEIIMAMIDANYLNFKNKNESYSKVISETDVENLLSMRRGAPTIWSFSALNRHYENLSPQQIISQFGLDYQYQKDGKTVTPYLVTEDTMEGNRKHWRQPFVFILETPMNEHIRASAKLPVDPRIMEWFKTMANDTKVSAETREEAKDFLARNKHNIHLIARNTGDQELNQKYKDREIKINDAPYTGNTAPQYGNKLEGQRAYADVIQEMYLTEASPISPGAKIYAKFPKPGVDAERADLPAGSEQVEIAEWDGTQWKITGALQKNFNHTLEKYSDDIKQQWEKKTFTIEQVAEWIKTGKQKTTKSLN